MDIKTVSTLVSEADKAVLVLEQYIEPQIKIKKDTILKDVCDYIFKTLSDANWIFKGASYFSSISLNNTGVLYVGNSSALPSMKPVAKITKDGVKLIYNMNEDEALILIHNWDRFKPELHKSITQSVENKQKEINQRINHLAYIQQQYDEFYV